MFTKVVYARKPILSGLHQSSRASREDVITYHVINGIALQ